MTGSFNAITQFNVKIQFLYFAVAFNSLHFQAISIIPSTNQYYNTINEELNLLSLKYNDNLNTTITLSY